MEVYGDSERYELKYCVDNYCGYGLVLALVVRVELVPFFLPDDPEEDLAHDYGKEDEEVDDHDQDVYDEEDNGYVGLTVCPFR